LCLILQPACYGATGRISKINAATNASTAEITGLFSVVSSNGNAFGPTEIVFSPSGDMYIAVNYNVAESTAQFVSDGATLAWQGSSVLKRTGSNTVQKVADCATAEFAHDYDGDGADSDVFGIALHPYDWTKMLIADAGELFLIVKK
jgi:DNA-binding beta-propeller fold protein YncE